MLCKNMKKFGMVVTRKKIRLYINESRRLMQFLGPPVNLYKITKFQKDYFFNFKKWGVSVSFFMAFQKQILISTIFLVMRNNRRNTQLFSNLTNFVSYSNQVDIHKFKRIPDSSCMQIKIVTFYFFDLYTCLPKLDYLFF